LSVDIVVFAKQVPDPEGSPSSYHINSAERKVEARGIPPVINPFDESAFEMALRIKDESGAHITLISAGSNLSRPVILKALAAGADSALLVTDQAIEAFSLDSLATAKILAAAVGRLARFDLILCGMQASDTNAGLIGPMVASLLGVPCVTLARKAHVEGGMLEVERVVQDAYEVVLCPLPALVTVTGEAGELRYPSLQAIKGAKEIPQETLGLSDLQLDLFSPPRVELISLSAPQRERRCRIVEGESGREAGEKLAVILREDGVL